MSTPITAVDVHSNLSDSCQSHGSSLSMPHMTTSESTFCTSNYYPSLLAASVFGILNVFFSFAITANTILQLSAGWATLLVSLVCYQWFDLHGTKMTRREHVYFDEANLLRTSERLDFNLPPVIEDLTPGDIPESRKPLLQQLFRDEKDEEMQKWYKQHYGKVYENAMRAAKQERMMEEVTRQQKPQKKDD
uniref:Uncharacterized protein n=1 Tax=Parascaris univalens TaxID=6257 RepID=A0A915C6D6_PARUN